MLERHQVLSSYFVCSLTLGSCVYGFVMWGQSLLSVPGNLVPFLLSEAPYQAEEVPRRLRLKGSASYLWICSMFSSPLSDQLSRGDNYVSQPDLLPGSRMSVPGSRSSWLLHNKGCNLAEVTKPTTCSSARCVSRWVTPKRD